MKVSSKILAVSLLTLAVADAASTAAFARGGGSNFMNSPGYQRRLQESRGQVPNESGSLFSKPPVTYPVKPTRKRGKR